MKSWYRGNETWEEVGGPEDSWIEPLGEIWEAIDGPADSWTKPGAERQIRILLLFPASSRDDTIVCETELVNIDEVGQPLDRVSSTNRPPSPALPTSVNDDAMLLAARRVACLEGDRIAKSRPQTMYQLLPHLATVGSGQDRGTEPAVNNEDEYNLATDRGTYEALSYTWGDEWPKEAILCDNEEMEIRQNLFNALQQLRRPDCVRRLWADAICINQDDPEEKAAQVAIMSTIFAKAERVIVWLGVDSEHEDGRKMAAFVKEHVRNPLLWRHRYEEIDYIPPICEALGDRAEEYRELQRDSPFQRDTRISSTVERFLRRSWFGRRWIVQEVFSARNVTVLCGASQIDWIGLCSAVSMISTCIQTISGRISRHQEDLKDIANAKLICGHYNQLRTRVTKSTSITLENYSAKQTKKQWAPSIEPDPLLEWLKTFSSFNCSDDRDRIFALISMVDSKSAGKPRILHFPIDAVVYPDHVGWSSKQYHLDRRNERAGWLPDYLISPNYHNSVESVYFRLALNMVRLDRAIELLQCTARLRHSLTKGAILSGRLPSWVPDWRAKEDYDPDITRQTEFEQWPASIAPDRMSLHMQGYPFDTVVEVYGCPLDGDMNRFLTSRGHRCHAIACRKNYLESEDQSKYESLIQPGDELFFFNRLDRTDSCFAFRPVHRPLPRKERPNRVSRDHRGEDDEADGDSQSDGAIEVTDTKDVQNTSSHRLNEESDDASEASDNDFEELPSLCQQNGTNCVRYIMITETDVQADKLNESDVARARKLWRPGWIKQMHSQVLHIV